MANSQDQEWRDPNGALDESVTTPDYRLRSVLARVLSERDALIVEHSAIEAASQRELDKALADLAAMTAERDTCLRGAEQLQGQVRALAGPYRDQQAKIAKLKDELKAEREQKLEEWQKCWYEEHDKLRAELDRTKLEFACLVKVALQRQERAETAERQRDNLLDTVPEGGWAARALDAEANAKALANELREAKDVLSLCDQGRSGKIQDCMDGRAVALGEAQGYGAWMDSFQRMWQLKDPIGCFTVGPCLATVRGTIKRINKVLKEHTA